MSLTESEFSLIYLFVRENYGLNTEKKRYLAKSRPASRIERSASASFGECRKKLSADSGGNMALGVSEARGGKRC